MSETPKLLPQAIEAAQKAVMKYPYFTEREALKIAEATVAAWNTRAPSTVGVEASPDDLRALGWTVAIHNDYRIGGKACTFWLFVRNGVAVKGEGPTDADALNEVRRAISPTLASEKEGGKGAPDYEAAGIGEVLRQAKSEANEKLYGKSSHASLIAKGGEK